MWDARRHRRRSSHRLTDRRSRLAAAHTPAGKATAMPSRVKILLLVGDFVEDYEASAR